MLKYPDGKTPTQYESSHENLCCVYLQVLLERIIYISALWLMQLVIQIQYSSQVTKITKKLV
jgi:hypothetical protein